ncbi:hypothetical protein BR93DRAFT_23924 [Coniochaeta sp. PMI_546]|nr:hypothetical protein BR93DRAFT_23924 [Coniochaeta sp. PMI_546]
MTAANQTRRMLAAVFVVEGLLYVAVVPFGYGGVMISRYICVISLVIFLLIYTHSLVCVPNVVPGKDCVEDLCWIAGVITIVRPSSTSSSRVACSKLIPLKLNHLPTTEVQLFKPGGSDPMRNISCSHLNAHRQQEQINLRRLLSSFPEGRIRRSVASAYVAAC